MTIAITLPNSFDIENYEGLQSFLIDHLELDASTQAQLPTLIRLAEAHMARKLTTPNRETTTTLATISGTQAVSLPDDFKQVRQIKIAGDDSTGYPLEQVALNTVEAYDYAGKPLAFAIFGSNLLMGPVPDAVYILTIRYIASFTSLTANSQTNWLLTGHPDAYVWTSAAFICQHLGDSENATLYFGLAQSVLEEINDEARRYRNSQPIRMRSAVVV